MLIVGHAELNDILNHRGSVEDCILYVTLFLCDECAKAITESGIKEIVSLEDKYTGPPENIVAKKLFDTSDVKYRQYQKTNQNIVISI